MATNKKPTNVLLSNSTVLENSKGLVIGTLTAVDPNVGDIVHFTTSDSRFEIVGNLLKLRDGVALNHEKTPTTAVKVTAIDAGGLAYSKNLSTTVQDVEPTATTIAISNPKVAGNQIGKFIQLRPSRINNSRCRRSSTYGYCAR